MTPPITRARSKRMSMVHACAIALNIYVVHAQGARLAGRWPAAFYQLKALSKLSCKFIFKENPFLLGLVNETKV